LSRKGFSPKNIILLLSIVLIIIIGIVYYFKVTKEKTIFGSLGIIPEKGMQITEATTVLINCDSDLDCLEQTKCERRMLFNMTGVCGSNKICSYGNWTFKGCIQSIKYCGADCASDVDCQNLPPGMCDINTCICM
jgi:hypothetical protein